MCDGKTWRRGWRKLKRAEKVAFVRGDADVDFQYVADVIDMAHHAGVERIGLLTEQPESEGE